MNVQLSLSRDAYLSVKFESVIEQFRPQMPEGFAFVVTPNGSHEGVTVNTNSRDEELAREIVKALESEV